MGDNRDQIDFWSGVGGAKWLAAEKRLDIDIAQFGAMALRVARVRPGERVLDIGCGTGETTLALAQAVGPSGRVVGLDVSPPLLAAARARAAGFAQADFVLADASAHRFAREFDLLFSQFGVMFFADPLAAFVNLRTALKPGGRLVFVCWRAFKENAWAFVPFMAAVKHLPPVDRPGPDAPGPFAFADKERVLGILRQAGFADPAMEPVDGMIHQGATLDDTIRRVGEFGPTSRILADAPEAMRAAALDAVRVALAAHVGKHGVNLAGAAWIVTARAP